MNAPCFVEERVDPRLAFLARAAARFELVQVGVMDIDEAFEGLIVSLQCACSREMLARWERDFPPKRRPA
jgi:hypothetical protein